MKKLSILMIIISLLVVSFGCTKEIEEPIEKPIEEPVPVEKEVIIESVKKVSIDNMSLLDSFEFDFDNDGTLEIIGMYTNAHMEPNGEIVWDDGQNWKFIVHDTDKDYVLVDEYVQLGSIDFNVYTIDDEFYIATYSGRTASLTLNLYHYDRENDSFLMTTPFETVGNVNMLKSSYGY